MLSRGHSWPYICELSFAVLLGMLLVSQAVQVAPMADQVEAVQGLLERLLPHGHAAFFQLHLRKEALEEAAAFFEVSVDPTGIVHVKGTSGVSLSWRHGMLIMVQTCVHAIKFGFTASHRH